MFQNARKKIALAIGATSTAMLSGVAFATTATPIDTTEATAQLAEVETGLVAVGGVLIALAAVAVGFKWIKAMVFG